MAIHSKIRHHIIRTLDVLRYGWVDGILPSQSRATRTCMILRVKITPQYVGVKRLNQQICQLVLLHMDIQHAVCPQRAKGECPLCEMFFHTHYQPDMLEEPVHMDDEAAHLPGVEPSLQITVNWADIFTEEERIEIMKKKRPPRTKEQCPVCKFFFYKNTPSQLYCSGAWCDRGEVDSSVLATVLVEVVFTDEDGMDSRKDSRGVAEMDDGGPPSKNQDKQMSTQETEGST